MDDGTDEWVQQLQRERLELKKFGRVPSYTDQVGPDIDIDALTQKLAKTKTSNKTFNTYKMIIEDEIPDKNKLPSLHTIFAKRNIKKVTVISNFSSSNQQQNDNYCEDLLKGIFVFSIKDQGFFHIGGAENIIEAYLLEEYGYDKTTLQELIRSYQQTQQELKTLKKKSNTGTLLLVGIGSVAATLGMQLLYKSLK